MKKLQDLFGRVGLIRPPNQTLRLSAQRSIKDMVGPEIKLVDLAVRGGTLFVRTSPAVKNQIFLKKKEILNSIRKSLNGNNFPLTDIR